MLSEAAKAKLVRVVGDVLRRGGQRALEEGAYYGPKRTIEAIVRHFPNDPLAQDLAANADEAERIVASMLGYH